MSTADTIRPRVATLLLASSMFLTGASGFIFECILSTVATFILGNSIEQFSVTISLMMLMMGFASFWQKKISDDHLVEKFLAVEVGLALLGGFAPIAVYAAYATMEVHFIAVQYFFILAIGFLIGLEIPLVLRLNRNYLPKLKSNLASVFSTDYVGAFIGAIVWVYVLLRYFPLTEISFFVAGINFTVALATYSYFFYHRAASRRPLAIATIAVTATSLAYGYSQNRDWNGVLEQRFFSEPIAYSITTQYQHIVLTASASPTNYRLYINGNLQFASVDEHIYHEMLVHPGMTLSAKRDRILILGGGDGLALREVLKHPETREVTLVDIDPGMIEFAKHHEVMTELNSNAFQDARVATEMIQTSSEETTSQPVYQYARHLGIDSDDVLAEAAEVNVYTIDADKILKQLRGTYDVIVIDLPDPNSVELVKLYSREFYMKLNRLLTTGGMVAMQATSPYHAKESFLCILRTIRSAGFDALPYHENVPSFGDWGWILAWNTSQTQQELQTRIAALEQFAVDVDALRYLTPARFTASTSFGKDTLKTESTILNTLMMPVLLRYYLTEAWLR